MADTKELVSVLSEFRTADLLSDERDNQWIPPLIKPPAAEIQGDAFRPSTTYVLDASPHSLAFPILGSHFSLAFTFGMQEVVAWIRSGVWTASSGNRPVRLVHFNSFVDVGHIRHVSHIINPWLRKYLTHMCPRRGMELKELSKAHS